MMIGPVDIGHHGVDSLDSLEALMFPDFGLLKTASQMKNGRGFVVIGGIVSHKALEVVHDFCMGFIHHNDTFRVSSICIVIIYYSNHIHCIFNFDS